MERLRILAAAAALGEFTVSQLAAYSGANENTIRSVLDREPDLFEELPVKMERAATGRPPKHYRVVDADRIRAQVREMEQGVAALTEMSPSQRERAIEADNFRSAALVVAEDAVVRAWQAEDEGERKLRARTALESISQARSQGEGQTVLERNLDRRARSLEVLADFALTQATRHEPTTDSLDRAAKALAEFQEVAPPEHARRLLAGLLDAGVPLRPQELVLAEDRGRMADALIRAAAALSDLRSYPEAVDGFDAVVQALEDSREPALRAKVARALVLKGATLQRRGLLDQALAGIDHALDLAVESDLLSDAVAAEALSYRGRILSQMGRSEQAIDAYGDLLSRFGEVGEYNVRSLVAQARVNLAACLAGINQYEDAMNLLDELVSGSEFEDAVVTALVSKGAMQAQVGRMAEAMTTFGHAADRLRAYDAALVGDRVVLTDMAPHSTALSLNAQVMAWIGRSLATPGLRETVAQIQARLLPFALDSTTMMGQWAGAIAEPPGSLHYRHTHIAARVESKPLFETLPHGGTPVAPPVPGEGRDRLDVGVTTIGFD